MPRSQPEYVETDSLNRRRPSNRVWFRTAFQEYKLVASDCYALHLGGVSFALGD